MLTPLSRNTLTQQATVILRRFILSAELAADDQLPSECALSASLSVSRNIVREALSVLVAEGLSELLPLLVEHFRLRVVHQPTVMLHNAARVVAKHQQIIDVLKTGDPATVRAALLAHPLATQES